MKNRPQTLIIAALVGAILPVAPVFAQNSPANATTPANVTNPGPKKELPPLKLPEIPGEDKLLPEVEGEDKAVPAAPLEPLPLPTGPAEIKSGLPQNQPYLFRMEWDGKLIGYSTFIISGQMSLGKQSTYIINSRSKLKLGPHKSDALGYENKLLVDSKTLVPTFFRSIQIRGDLEGPKSVPEMALECLYSTTMIAQKNLSGKLSQSHFHAYEGEAPRLLSNNLWGHFDSAPEHYWLLVRSAIKGGNLPTYDPIMRGAGSLTIYAPQKEKWKFGNRELDTLVYPISDLEGVLLARVRVTAKDLDLVEIVEVGRGITMRRSEDAKLLAQFDKVKGTDLQSRRLAPSNVLFSEPEKLTALEAEIDMDLRGGQFADHRVLGYRQYFTGEMKEGYMKGRVVVRSVPRDTQYQTKYPFRPTDKPPAELERYVKPSPGVEADFVPLKNKALELAWKSESTFQAGRKLLSFVTQINEGVSLPSARYAFESGTGNPESKALLMVAMARGVGIPARRIGGLLNRENTFVPHHWVELWLGPAEGWVPFDPTTQEAGHVGASHIALWESGDVQRLEIAVKSYAPRAPKKTAYFERDVTWPLGEERIYDVLRDGQKVGEEVAAIREVVVKDEGDYFKFDTSSNVTVNGKNLVSSGSLLVDGFGLPGAFALRQGENPDPTQQYRFREDAAYLETPGKEKDKPVVREIPLSYGTYFADQRFLSQWALIVGQAQLPTAKSSVVPGLPNLKAASTPPPQALALKAGDRVSCSVFIPELLKSQEINFDVKESEPLKLGDKEQEVLLLESEAGMQFYLNKQNQVVKVAVPKQKLELVLRAVNSKI